MSRVYKEKDLWRFQDPQFGLYDFKQVAEGPYAHLKATIYNGLNANDDHILQGELLIILRLMIAHLRLARFIDHMVAPVSISQCLSLSIHSKVEASV